MCRVEAERLLGVGEKLLQSQDLNGTKDLAIPSSFGSAIFPDWYSILQLPCRSDDPDLVKKQFRRLALLLHPDKNKFPFTGQAFQLVIDALFHRAVEDDEFARQVPRLWFPSR